MGKKKIQWMAAIILFSAGAAILGVLGVTELSRGLVTPLWTFGLMFLAYATMRESTSDPKS